VKGLAVSLSLSSLYARRMDCRTLGCFSIALILALCHVLPVAAQEQPVGDYPTQFLEKLRSRGWHDVALEYLEEAENDPLASPEFLADRDYHLAVTRTTLARQAVGDKERQSQLDRAIADFQAFATANPESSHYVDALSQAGNLLAEQALVLLNKADRLPASAVAEQESLRASAREILEKASAAVSQMLESAEARLAKLPRGAALQANRGNVQLKQDLQGKLAEGKFLAANLHFEKARTFDKDSDEHVKALEEAAAAFKQVQKEYENKLVGFFAVLYEGRCFQAAGDYDKALDTYNDLTSQPVGQADFRKLIARAYRHRAECHLAREEPEKAIEECTTWLDESSVDERKEPEWLAVAFQLANAYSAQAEADSGNDSASKLRTEARKLYRDLSRQPGEFQEAARTALALAGGDEIKPVDVKSFGDAFAAGKSAIEQMNSSQLAVKLAANNNPEGVADLKEQVDANRAAALKYFQSAVEMADDKSPAEDVVATHYYLCWLYWNDGRTEEAAELGQRIADKYPDSPFAPTAAKITLAAYERLFLQAKTSSSEATISAAGEKLRNIAELIVERWNDSDAARDATNLLISLALKDNDFTEADRLLAELPEKSRGSAGLTLGATMWSRYLEQSANKENASNPATDELKTRATQLLAGGYESLADAHAEISSSQAAAVLYYVQALLADNKPDEALEVLENKRVGPLALMKRNTGAEHEKAFALEASKAALRAFLSVDPPRTDDALAMMEQLENIASEAGKDPSQLTGIYVNLGLQLQEQIKRLTAAGEKDKAQAVAGAFANLLERVAAQGDSQSWAVRNWLAQTSLQLGSGLAGGAADRYLDQAEKAFRDILNAAAKDPKFAPSELAILAVRKKLGETMQARGDFAGAVEQFTEILAKKPNMLELQQSTAAALQAWGIAKKDPTIIDQAIRGTKPQANAQNLVWGWLRLATVADAAKRKAEQKGDDAAAGKYSDAYFSARYEAARGRLAAGKLATGDSQAKQLGTVRQSITALKQLSPDMGGEQWAAKFEALLKDVETLLKEAGE
jgi:tetratricopeptide (TPR) repeat protein